MKSIENAQSRQEPVTIHGPNVKSKKSISRKRPIQIKHRSILIETDFHVRSMEALALDAAFDAVSFDTTPTSVRPCGVTEPVVIENKIYYTKSDRFKQKSGDFNPLSPTKIAEVVRIK
jgi:hypothetical protein